MDILKRYEPACVSAARLRGTAVPLNGCDRRSSNRSARSTRGSALASRPDVPGNRQGPRYLQAFGGGVPATVNDYASQKLLN